jgi:hypothetical protein
MGKFVGKSKADVIEELERAFSSLANDDSSIPVEVSGEDKEVAEKKALAQEEQDGNVREGSKRRDSNCLCSD